ncbi:hypothetical protein RI129_003671 [Pyrocoelia pectoralis]|uniref:FP protein C-terminal domain-containing protein n=1 Tax=Pyrocoelia pectoralis TaxID=417401 RepID=A0AAN7VRS0_9COLE
MSEISKVREGQIQMEKDINESLNLCHAKLDDNTEALKSQRESIERHEEEIDALKTVNTVLKKRLTAVEYDLDAEKQERRLNSIEVFGLPVNGTETPAQAFYGLCNAIGVTIEDNMIDDCFKLKKVDTIKYPTIIVRFVKRSDKNNLMSKVRVRRNLSTAILGMKESSPIYINEALTSTRKKTLLAARKLVAEYGWKYVWSRTGKIFVRKSDSSKIHAVNSIEELNEIFGARK